MELVGNGIFLNDLGLKKINIATFEIVKNFGFSDSFRKIKKVFFFVKNE